MWLPHGSGCKSKRCDWKRACGWGAPHNASPNGPVFRLHSQQVQYLPQRWKEDGVVTISFYQRRPPSTGDRRGGVWGIFVLKVKLWYQGDGVPVIRMNRSVHPVNLGKQLNLFCFADPWRFALREGLSPAPRNLPPLQLPSPQELKHVHKNIPLLVIIHHPVFIHWSWRTLIVFTQSLVSCLTKGEILCLTVLLKINSPMF